MDREKRKIEDEIDFRELFRHPIRLFGYLYPLVLVLVLVLGYFFIKNLDSMYANAVDPVLDDTTYTVQQIPEKKGQDVPGVNIADISRPDDAMIARGKELYQANCMSCHGEGGNGDGPAGAALNPKPRNFHQDEGWKNGKKISGLYKTLQEGIPGTPMAPYEYLPPADRFAIIHYVRTLGGNYPAIAGDEMQQLDNTYKLSSGIKTAGTMPVDKAIVKVADEDSARVNKTYSVLQRITNSTEMEGAQIFDRLSYDKFAALYVLSGDNRWISNTSEFSRILASAVNKGFNSSVLTLPGDDLIKLQGFLANAFAAG